MSVIYILIPIAILFTAIAIYLFFWAVKTEQFDDLEKQGMSILFDDEKSNKQQTAKDAPQSSVKHSNHYDASESGNEKSPQQAQDSDQTR
ncbi:cbb3-type cytochrome oxidase assembly protein CcoS [Thalassotalea maritima]|uniref:cbb3-type cytochrome oxidase assembly protein CcoS n=1 Tax=Thalassotalea maritima TaxID=3242416 RepID=UPI0035274C1C